MAEVFHALGLHMHQPPNNLRILIDENPFEAEQIIRCYYRAAEYAHRYAGLGSLQVGFSGVLLEQFLDPYIVDRYRAYVDIPEMLDLYRTAPNIEIIGMGYYHPVFPLIPKEDWSEHLQMGVEICKQLFGKPPKGFWPSEMAFSMEMIPAIKEAGYNYIVVDHVHVTPEKKGEELDPFQPYLAAFEDEEIAVIPRNRDISNAQESGMDAVWFLNEVEHKLKDTPASGEYRLVTTWSDGENGGWFRRMDETSGFFGHFFVPLMEHIRRGESLLQQITLSEYLQLAPPTRRAKVRTGAWNVASTSGYDFSQWSGTENQKKAIEALCGVSKRYWQVAAKESSLDSSQRQQLQYARGLLLDAETSCYLFWGDQWLPRLFDKLEQVQRALPA